jgi:hypothetical protein
VITEKQTWGDSSEDGFALDAFWMRWVPRDKKVGSAQEFK